MRKSEELNNPGSCMSRAHLDEMTFVLLGRDIVAPKVIREWCRLRCLYGKNTVKDRQIVEALECADAMERENGKGDKFGPLLAASRAGLPQTGGPYVRVGNFDTSVGQGCDECGNTHGDAHSSTCTRGRSA